jgi:hypothetical protein
VKTARAVPARLRAVVAGPRVTVAIAGALLTTALGACGTSAQGRSGVDSSSIAGPACGAAAPKALAEATGHAAMQIYAGERSSPAVSARKNQVERYGPLLSALASGDRVGVRAAVHSLVYSGTHIVRLRVLQGTRVLADIGGPYVLAPVAGDLRLHGRVVGQYLLAIQDDLGYVKLETRYIGVPLVLHRGSHRVPLEGTLAPGPRTIPDHGPVSYRGASYESFSFTAQAYPRGALRISLLVPLPHSLSGLSCASIKISELGRIVHRLWDRFSLAGAPPYAYVHSSQALTGGMSYVRLDARQLAGSTQPGPSHLPDQGAVSYRGVTYGVFSFVGRTAAGTVRVYLLVAS